MDRKRKTSPTLGELLERGHDPLAVSTAAPRRAMRVARGGRMNATPPPDRPVLDQRSPTR
jgi:hypothetical protein